MPEDKKAKAPEPEPEEPDLEELLTTESSPDTGIIERWRRADGSIVKVKVVRRDSRQVIEVEPKS